MRSTVDCCGQNNSQIPNPVILRLNVCGDFIFILFYVKPIFIFYFIFFYFLIFYLFIIYCFFNGLFCFVLSNAMLS